MSNLPPQRCSDEESCCEGDVPSRPVPARYRPTRELAIAEEAAREGDLRHAAFHAATALALNPNHPRSQALVDELLEEPLGLWDTVRKWFGDSDPAPLFPKDKWYGWAAVRARSHWKIGELEAAFERLLEVAAAVPHVDYSIWLLSIAAQAQSRRILLSSSAFVGCTTNLMRRFVGILRLRPSEQAFHAPWAKLGARLLETQKECSSAMDPWLLMCTSSFFRRAGQVDQALCLAEDGLKLVHTKETLPLVQTQLGLAARALGDWERAAKVFSEAYEQTGEYSYLCEVARTRFDQGNFEEALRLFTKADPDSIDDELKVSIKLCRELLGQEPHALASLFPNRRPDMDDVRRVFCGDGTHLRMGDATTNVLARYLDENPEAKPPIALKFSVSHLESGSVHLALSLAVGKTTDQLPYTFEARPHPSPFSPLKPEGFALWRDSDSIMVPALPQPSLETMEMVKNMAGLPSPSMLDLRRRAKQLSHPKTDTVELVAAMLHPPELPPGQRPDFHVFHWQLCCALLLSELKTHEPWEASVRRDILHALLFGPPDWTTAAALITLTELALDDVSALEDLRDWLDELVLYAPSQGHCPWAGAVAYTHGRLPALRPDLLSTLQPWLEPVL